MTTTFFGAMRTPSASVEAAAGDCVVRNQVACWASQVHVTPNPPANPTSTDATGVPVTFESAARYENNGGGGTGFASFSFSNIWSRRANRLYGASGEGSRNIIEPARVSSSWTTGAV